MSVLIKEGNRQPAPSFSAGSRRAKSQARAIVKFAFLGALSAAVLVLASATRGWPFPSLTAEPWLFQFSPHSKALKYLLLAVFYLSALGLSYCWLRLLRIARTGELQPRQVMFIFALWSGVLFFATPLFSGDVYVYWADGQLQARGFDAYQWGVSSLGAIPSVFMVHPLWRSTSTMYGPLFVRLCQAIAQATQSSVVAGVLIFRALAVCAVVVTGFSLASLGKKYRVPMGPGLVFCLLNPVTMFHLVGGAHNDAMMLACVSSALSIGFQKKSILWRTLALALCAASGAFKIPGLFGAFVLGWYWFASTQSRAIRLRGHDFGSIRQVLGAALAGAGALVALEIETLATGLGWGWLRASKVPGIAHPLLAPVNALGLSFGSLFGEGYQLSTYTRVAGTIAALALAVWVTARNGRDPSPTALVASFGWALLAIGWMGPAVYPWYIAWGIALAGAYGLRNEARVLEAMPVVLTLLIAPGGYGILDMLQGNWRVVMAFLALGMAVTAVRAIINDARIAHSSIT